MPSAQNRSNTRHSRGQEWRAIEEKHPPGSTDRVWNRLAVHCAFHEVIGDAAIDCRYLE